MTPPAAWRDRLERVEWDLCELIQEAENAGWLRAPARGPLTRALAYIRRVLGAA